jgi:hypothetical protein
MTRIETIDLYKSYLASFTEDQALCLMRGIDESTEGYVTNVEFNHSIDSLRAELHNSISDLRKDIKWLSWVIFGIGTLVAVPILERLVGFLK